MGHKRLLSGLSDNRAGSLQPPSEFMAEQHRGIGEKFAANPVTSTRSLTIRVYTSPGHSGFVLQLSLSYDSGTGNRPFGFGWSLALHHSPAKPTRAYPNISIQGNPTTSSCPMLSTSCHSWSRTTTSQRNLSYLHGPCPKKVEASVYHVDID